MHTLHVHNVPDELYNRLRQLAKAKQHSLSAQVLLLLVQALEDEAEHQGQAQILNNIRRQQFTPPHAAPDSLEMLAADRKR